MQKNTLQLLIKDMEKRRDDINKWALRHCEDEKFQDEIKFIEGSIHELSHYIDKMKLIEELNDK